MLCASTWVHCDTHTRCTCRSSLLQGSPSTRVAFSLLWLPWPRCFVSRSTHGFKKPALLSLNNKTANRLRMGNIAQLAMTANKAESFLLVKELSASGKGRADIVQQLIKVGASVNTTSGQGDPLVCLAAGSGHCEALKVLIDCGADLTQLSKNGGSALHAAV